MSARVAYVSHSLVASRQRLFEEELRRQIEPTGFGLEVVFPRKWGRHEREGGYVLDRAGDMVEFTWPPVMFEKWTRDPPALVLLQQEAYCRSAVETAIWCKAHDVPLVTFSWENLHAPVGEALEVLAGATVNLFGNARACELARSSSERVARVPSAILPQVGVDTGLFHIMPRLMARKRFDILFNGRAEDPMKGLSVLEEAVKSEGWRVGHGFKMGNPAYELQAARYNLSTVTCVPSIDIPGRPREQFAPMVSIESLFCGTPIVTTDQEAIREWLGSCPAVFWSKMGDAKSLHAALNQALTMHLKEPEEFHTLARRGAAWARKRFTNEEVARKYMNVIKQTLDGN